MRCKAFEVSIALEIQAVTCPGVWLCPNGKCTLQIYMLGLCTQTSGRKPLFPLLIHETFLFQKTFDNIMKLKELERFLSRELVYMELIQWENCKTANVLATFKTSLADILYPLLSNQGTIAGVDTDLLMEATKQFPGIIAPKIEVSTKTTIQEVLCTVNNERKDVVVINPKLVSSKCVPKRRNPLRQKKVCHTFEYHRERVGRPPKKAMANDQNYIIRLKSPGSARSCRQTDCKCCKLKEKHFNRIS